jgi:hypothetical protein
MYVLKFSSLFIQVYPFLCLQFHVLNLKLDIASSIEYFYRVDVYN